MKSWIARSTKIAARFLMVLLPAAVSAQETPQTPSVRYREVRVEGPAIIAELTKLLGADGFDAVLRVNRIDLPHLRKDSVIVVPETFVSLAALSPFPASLIVDFDLPRVLIVSRRVQAFAAYESGTLVRWGPVSTGREASPTPAGLFATNWKSKLRRSSDNREWLLPWYVNFINESGVSFHQFALPGYPASHACVRLLEDDAKWVYDWAETWTLSTDKRTVLVHGTPVVVFGDYSFKQPGPWTLLASDPLATTITTQEIQSSLAAHKKQLTEWIAVRRSAAVLK